MNIVDAVNIMDAVHIMAVVGLVDALKLFNNQKSIMTAYDLRQMNNR